jgi:hypothetical protein
MYLPSIPRGGASRTIVLGHGQDFIKVDGIVVQIRFNDVDATTRLFFGIGRIVVALAVLFRENGTSVSVDVKVSLARNHFGEPQECWIIDLTGLDSNGFGEETLVEEKVATWKTKVITVGI